MYYTFKWYNATQRENDRFGRSVPGDNTTISRFRRHSQSVRHSHKCEPYFETLVSRRSITTKYLSRPMPPTPLSSSPSSSFVEENAERRKMHNTWRTSSLGNIKWNAKQYLLSNYPTLSVCCRNKICHFEIVYTTARVPFNSFLFIRFGFWILQMTYDVRWNHLAVPWARVRVSGRDKKRSKHYRDL